jgi:hypothetical protein
VDADKDRVYLSDGTHSAPLITNANVEFQGGAFLPRKPWRQPTEWERERLWQNSQITDVDFVGVFKVPTELLVGLLNNVDAGHGCAPWQLEADRVKQFVDPLVAFLCDRFGYRDEPIVHGIAVHEPGLETVTFDTVNRKFLGLHLDSWDRRPLEIRAQSLNRICINIGTEPRHFLFLNLSLIEMARILEQRGEKNRYVNLNSLGPAFMSQLPGYPIVRVRISPGEAYIAPTDNIIHDGSTVDSCGPSVSLTVRGWFVA